MATPVYTDDIIPAQNRAEITSVNDEDLLIVSQSNELKKITKSNLKESLGVNENASNISTNATNITTVSDRQDVILENLITNGDFANGTTGWNSEEGVSTVSSNILTNTANGTAAYSRINQLIDVTANENDYIFVISKRQVTNSDCESLVMFIRNNYSLPLQNLEPILNPSANTEYIQYGSVVASGDYSQIRVYLENRYVNTTTASGKVMEVDGTYGIFVLNLTSIFGSGNEPSADLMKKAIDIVGYFEDTHTMTNKEIMLAYSEYLKDIVTAITELGGTI